DAAAERALSAMVSAARAVCLPLEPGLAETGEAGGTTFDRLLGETSEFDNASPGGRFSKYFVRARLSRTGDVSLAQARQRVEEAQLFIDAAHAYQAKAGDR